MIGGPALGGLLFALQPELVYAVAAVLSLVALAAVLALRSGREGVGTGSPDLASVLGGVRLVRRTPVLLGAISLDLFAVLFGGAVALLPVFAKDVLEVGPAGLGVLRAAPAVGALVAAVVLDAAPGPPPCRADAADRGRPLRRHDRRLRPLGDDVALAARARGGRRASTW